MRSCSRLRCRNVTTRGLTLFLAFGIWCFLSPAAMRVTAYGIPQPMVQQQGPAQTSGAEEAPVGTPSQSELLKQQNELLQRHNSELLQVVLWSLTFAAVFLIGVLGLIGFITTRRYDQEKEALRAHLEGQVAAAVARLETGLANKVETLRVAHEASAKALKEGLHKEAEVVAEQVLAPTSRRLSGLEDEVEDFSSSLRRWRQSSGKRRKFPPTQYATGRNSARLRSTWEVPGG